MSRMEAVTGKAIPAYNGLTRVEAIRQLLLENGISPAKDKFDLEDQFIDMKGYEWGGDQMYKIEARELDERGSTEASLNDDGSIDFTFLWYNGGGHFSEVLEQAVKQVKT